MARRAVVKRGGDAVADRLTDLLIVQLALAGVKQHAIRRIAGCNLARVVRIAKEIKTKGKGN